MSHSDFLILPDRLAQPYTNPLKGAFLLRWYTIFANLVEMVYNIYVI